MYGKGHHFGQMGKVEGQKSFKNKSGPMLCSTGQINGQSNMLISRVAYFSLNIVIILREDKSTAVTKHFFYKYNSSCSLADKNKAKIKTERWMEKHNDNKNHVRISYS